MSWFWSSSSSTSAGPKAADGRKNDIYSDLDPEYQAIARGEHVDMKSRPQDPSSHQSGDSKQTVSSNQSLPQKLDLAIADSKTRKAQINGGAMFNCALAEYELNRCFTTGSWWDKAKLCEVEKGAFWECLESNKKALRILGYGENGNSTAQNEKILGIADELVSRTTVLAKGLARVSTADACSV